MPKLSKKIQTPSFAPLLWLLTPFLIVGAFSVLFVTAKKTAPVAQSCSASEFSGIFQKDEEVAYYDGKKIDAPSQEPEDISRLASVLGTTSGERWIDVDLSDQKLTAYEGDRVFLETKISSGLPWTPTPTGEFRVWIKLRATKMEGGSGKYYYYLPNVPYVMFFEGSGVSAGAGYSLHGTYWHNEFGTPRSHGCVNLPTPMAKEIFYWIGPSLADGKGTVRASNTNPGTRVVIHE
jgi:hypothetical protein